MTLTVTQGHGHCHYFIGSIIVFLLAIYSDNTLV